MARVVQSGRVIDGSLQVFRNRISADKKDLAVAEIVETVEPHHLACAPSCGTAFEQAANNEINANNPKSA